MAETPEEVYARILAEEQGKGSSPAVAEGRAKAARMRATKGLPTDAAGAAAASKSAAPAEPAPAAAAPEQPAAEAPEVPAAAPEQPAAEAPAAEAAAPAPAAAPSSPPPGPTEDPEEAFNRVLAEEQAKGSSPPVAQARAKAARMRAKKASAPAAPAAKPAAAPQPAAVGAAAPSSGGLAGSAPEVSSEGASEPPRTPPAAPEGGGRRAAARASAGGGGPAPERIQRLLAVVKPEAIQRVEKEPMDRVNVWPHLMAAEFLSIIAVTAFLVIFSTVVNAPFRELANINVTPNPSKAPWYFLGLQELLRYFHPQVAGVTIPQWLILAGIAWPFVDRNPSAKPSDRKLAIVMFTIFLVMSAVLAIIGSLFRGPGFNFVYPWDQGIFFEL